MDKEDILKLIHDAAVCETLNSVLEIEQATVEELDNTLIESGVTVSERVFALYVLNSYIELLKDNMSDKFKFDEYMENAGNDIDEDNDLLN